MHISNYIDMNQEVMVKKNGHYSLGSYPTKLKNLPPNSHVKVHVPCQDCSISFKRTWQLLNKASYFRCYACTRKFIGKTMNKEKMIKLAKARVGQMNGNWKLDTPKYSRYRSKVARLTNENYEKWKWIINPDNLPRTKCGTKGGYQIDHIISVKECYEAHVPPEKVAALENLQLLPWEENLKKSTGLSKLEGLI